MKCGMKCCIQLLCVGSRYQEDMVRKMALRLLNRGLYQVFQSWVAFWVRQIKVVRPFPDLEPLLF